MNNARSIFTGIAFAVGAISGFGCHSDPYHDQYIHEPAGASREGYYDDGRNYTPEDEQNSDTRYDRPHQWDNPHFEDYERRHQWDNPHWNNP